MSSSPFDQIGQPPQYSDEQKAQFNKLDYLIHKVFAESPEGAELLSIWKESLVMTPTATAGADLLMIGMAEGTKTFIRNLILTIEKVENE